MTLSKEEKPPPTKTYKVHIKTNPIKQKAIAENNNAVSKILDILKFEKIKLTQKHAKNANFIRFVEHHTYTQKIHL